MSELEVPAPSIEIKNGKDVGEMPDVSSAPRVSSELENKNAKDSISSKGLSATSNSTPKEVGLDELSDNGSFSDNESVYSYDSSPEEDELLPSAEPSQSNVESIEILKDLRTTIENSFQAHSSKTFIDLENVQEDAQNRFTVNLNVDPDGRVLEEMPEVMASTHAPKTGVGKLPTLDPSDTTQSLTVDSSKVKGEHDGAAENDAGSEEFGATTSEGKPGVEGSVPVTPKGKEDGQQEEASNAKMEEPDIHLPQAHGGAGEVRSNEKIIANNGWDELTESDLKKLFESQIQVDVLKENETIIEKADEQHTLNESSDLRPDTRGEKSSLPDHLEAHTTTEEKQELSGQVKSSDDKTITSTKQEQTSEADARGKSIALKDENQSITFNSQHLHDQLNLGFENRIVVKGGDVEPFKEAVHACLDRFIDEKVTVGSEQNLPEGFGPYLFKDEVFIEALAHYKGLTVDEIKKDLVDKIPELERAKADFTVWLKSIFIGTERSLFLNEGLKAMDEEFGNESLRNISDLEPVKLVFQQILEEVVGNPEVDLDDYETSGRFFKDDRFVEAFAVLSKRSISETKEYLSKKAHEFERRSGRETESWLFDLLNDVKLTQTEKAKDISVISWAANLITKSIQRVRKFSETKLGVRW